MRRKYGHGGDRRSEAFQDYRDNLEKPQQGTNPDYLLGRILNTKPDIFELYEMGWFPSAAAIC